MANRSPAHRVLHVVDRTSGGVPVAVATYIRNSPAGVEHHVLSPFDGGGLASLWDGLDAGFHNLPDGTRARIRSVREVAATLNPAVVHAHSSFAGVYARVAVGRGEPRVVYTPHCFSFARTDIGPVKRASYWLIEWLLGWRTDVLAGCSLGEQRLAERMLPLRGRTAHVPNVPSLASSQGAKSSVRNTGVLRVGMAGRLSPQKDPKYFARIITDLRLSAPAEVEGVWIGDGDEAIALLRDIGVEVTGWLQSTALVDALCGLDVYVHSAAWEGFPIAVLDAFAAGLPILVRPIPAFGALPEEIKVTSATLARLARAAADPAAFQAWVAENRSHWRDRLENNTAKAQQFALAQAWGLPS